MASMHISSAAKRNTSSIMRSLLSIGVSALIEAHLGYREPKKA